MDVSKRLLDLRSFMDDNRIDLSIIVQPDNQYYLCGFKAITYSRPVILTVSNDTANLIIPALEEEHAAEEARVNNAYIYYEHPEKEKIGKSHIDHLNKIISKFSKGIKVGVEFSFIPLEMADYLKKYGFALINIGNKIIEMRSIKDDNEVNILVNAGKIVSLGVKESLKYAAEGISEIEFDRIGHRVIYETSAREYPNLSIDVFGMTVSGTSRSLMPHLFSSTRKFKKGDVIIHSRQVGLNGYLAECERTFFIGQPTSKLKDIFKIVVEAQRAALDFIKSGIPAREVDIIARTIIQKAGYGDYAIHRIGHGIGLGGHELPYLRYDNDLVLKEGMAFCIEPGVYIPGVGGIRHSDTVILTKNGSNLITDYPRDLVDLIF
jgi:Xaa-Pro dipeptidase